MEARERNVAFPFCSTRCKQVDLGRWLDEKYRMPAEEDATDEAAEAEEK